MASTPQTGPLAHLALTAGPRYGDTLPVPKPVVTLGRAAGCDVVIDDDSVSAEHARLEFDLGAWRITDLGSTNGTSVEGVKLAPHVPTPLPYGSTVRLGGVRLQFRAERQADPASARAAYVPPPAQRTLKEERRTSRLPVWVVVLVLLLLAVVAFFVLQGAPAPRPAPVAPDAPAAQSTP
jgi:pSer/pThr/pTyr-binding forkhead associated (FHA) protein